MSPSHVQENEKVQEFGRWYLSKEGHKEGRGGFNCDELRHFIPITTLKRFLDPPRVNSLLDVVLSEQERDDVDDDLVSESYLRSFAILLAIGHPSFICRFVQHDSLRDDRLPFTARPGDFPFSSDDFFPKFEIKQWEFCAPRISISWNTIYNPNVILPITSKIPLGEGGSSYAYRIEIEGEYNALGSPSDGSDQQFGTNRNTYVLKTYRTNEAERNWRDERAAFRQLRLYPSPNIISCYGAFEVARSYHVILEWADQDTLEHYLQKTSPPSSVEEMTLFWARFLKVTHGLATIHGVPTEEGTSRKMNGSHNDIKPANILVLSCNSSSNYDCQFKIADLGLAHFEVATALPSSATLLDVCGTRDYGAPETFRLPSTVDIPLLIGRGIDIWSLGCIISEVIVWSLWGWHGLLEYRRRRALEIRERCGAEYCYRFHHNDQVLNIVNEKHRVARDLCQTKDRVIKEILNRMMEDMLVPQAGRSSAGNVMYKAERIVQEIIDQFRLNLDRVSGRSGQHVDGIYQDPPRPPGQLPPSMDSISVPNLSSDRRNELGPSHLDTGRSMFLDIADRSYGRYATFPNVVGQNPTHNLAPSPESMSPSPSHQGINHDQLSAHAIDENLTQRISQLGHSSTAAGLDRSGLGIHIRDKDDPGALKGTSDRPHAVYDTTEERQTEMSNRREEKQREMNPPPYLSLHDGLTWRAMCKAWGPMLSGEPPKLENSSSHFLYLHGRDHVFLIDNSKSMKPHRKNVKSIVTLLTYMVKKQDKDGVDIEFTNTENAKHSKKSSVLLDELDRVQYDGETDMHLRLSRLLQDKKAGEKPHNTPSRRISRVFSPVEQERRKWSFYILTDGKWNSSEVDSVILKLVDNMEANHFPKDDVGIQFIRFGKDPGAKIRLKRLDDGLGLKARNMDMVDTTFWNGNIWKQLLGAISPHFDDIEEDDDDDDNEDY